jgi:hypothetical protein
MTTIKLKPRASSLAPLLLLLLGCRSEHVDVPAPKPEATRFAEAVCAARERCGCSDSRFSSASQCESELATAFEATVAKEGLSLDTKCFEEVLAHEVVSECPSTPWSPWHSCTVIKGTQGEGEPCETSLELMPFSVSDCKDGLLCFGGFCEQDTYELILKNGDACQREFGCFTQHLYCGTDNRCHATKQPGEECEDYQACSLFHFCKGLSDGPAGICAPQAELGEPCGDGKDWLPCRAIHGESVWCNPSTALCELDRPTICRVTHPMLSDQ